MKISQISKRILGFSDSRILGFSDSRILGFILAVFLSLCTLNPLHAATVTWTWIGNGGDGSVTGSLGMTATNDANWVGPSSFAQMNGTIAGQGLQASNAFALLFNDDTLSMVLNTEQPLYSGGPAGIVRPMMITVIGTPGGTPGGTIVINSGTTGNDLALGPNWKTFDIQGGVDMSQSQVNLTLRGGADVQYVLEGANVDFKVAQSTTLTFNGFVVVRAGKTVNVSNGGSIIFAAPPAGGWAFQFGVDAGAASTLNLNDNSTIQIGIDGGASGNFVIGCDAGTGIVNQSSGTMLVTGNGRLILGVGVNSDLATKGIYNLSGGMLIANTSTNPIFIGGGYLIRAYGGYGALNLSGSGVAQLYTVNLGCPEGTAATTSATGEVYLGNYSTSGNLGGTLETNLIVKNGAGTITNGTGNTKNSLSKSVANFYFDGGTLKALMSSTRFMENLDKAQILSGGAIIDTTGSAGTGVAITIAQALTGTTNDGGLTKQGLGSLILSGSNAYTGANTIKGGTLQLGHAYAIGSGNNLAVNNGSLVMNGYNATVGTLSGSAGAVITNNAASNVVISASSAANSVYAGNLQNGGAGTLGLTKLGSGALTLTGNNSHSGATQVKEGALYLGSDLASSDVSVFSGATLGGKGAAGVSTGAVALNSLTLEEGATIKLELTANPATSDCFNVSNALTLDLSGGKILLDINDVASLVDTETTYTLISWNSAVGFSPENAGDYFALEDSTRGTLAWSGGSLTLIVSPIPEPGTWVLCLGGLGLLAGWQRHRRGR